MNGLNTYQSATSEMRNSPHCIPCQNRSQMEEWNETLNLSEKSNILIPQYRRQHQLIESSLKVFSKTSEYKVVSQEKIQSKLEKEPKLKHTIGGIFTTLTFEIMQSIGLSFITDE